MSAELDYSTGRAAIAYVGDTPWHQEGQIMAPGQTLEQWRIAAGLNWAVEKRQIYMCEPDIAPKKIPSHNALVRDDTGDVLSIVSNRYIPHQPQVIVEFFRDMISDYGFTMETMGALRGGRQIWALARMNDSFDLGLNDMMNSYVLLATSYDKSLATLAMYTNVRVVCSNTLSLATGNGKTRHGVRARHDAMLDSSAIKAQLGLLPEVRDEFETHAKEMTRYDMPEIETREYFADVLRIEDGNQPLAEQPLTFRKLMDCLQHAPGSDYTSANHTLWGAFNAVTYYQDHVAPDRGGRIGSATFGAGGQRKKRAWDLALEKMAA